jgi:hypothetical protein
MTHATVVILLLANIGKRIIFSAAMTYLLTRPLFAWPGGMPAWSIPVVALVYFVLEIPVARTGQRVTFSMRRFVLFCVAAVGTAAATAVLIVVNPDVVQKVISDGPFRMIYTALVILVTIYCQVWGFRREIEAVKAERAGRAVTDAGGALSRNAPADGELVRRKLSGFCGRKDVGPTAPCQCRRAQMRGDRLVSSFTFTGAGRTDARVYWKGTGINDEVATTDYTFDSFGRMTEVKAQDATPTTIVDFVRAYDYNGNPK